MGWESAFSVSVEGVTGQVRVAPRVTLVLEAGPADCVTLAVGTDFFLVTQSCAASGDAESLALQGHCQATQEARRLRSC